MTEKPPMPEWNEPAVQWQEGMKFTERETTLEAASYQQWIESVLPQVQSMKALDAKERNPEHGIKVGKDYFVLRTLPTYEYRQDFWCGFPVGRPGWHKTRLQLDTRGKYITWNGPVDIPILCTANMDVWMSLTPMEVYTQRAGVKRAQGNVLMGGLGLGWLARRVLEREQVEHLTVYDINQDVLDYFGAPLKEQFNGKLTLICDDVFQAKSLGKFDRILLDVWKTYGNAEFDRRVDEFEKHVPKKSIWTWGSARRG